MDEKGRPKRIPKELAARLEAARARRSMQGERRIITALFCDVSDSTAMAEQLDPEEWALIMDDAFEFLIAPIYRYEGTVARLMGDAILAFFGAPIAHEDDPQRAVMAGLDILTSIQPFRALIQRDYGLDFNVRVGINTGTVVVGEIGSDLALEYTAMGDAVNLAARMEQTAAPGTVQISGHTYDLVAPLFDVEPLGEIMAKGKSSRVTGYRVLRPKPEPGRLRGVAGLEAPLIGRAAELERLRALLAETRLGKGQIAFLVGEAGIGKSRLIEELRTEWPEQSTWSEIRSLSYEATRPYGLFLQMVRKSCGVDEYDPPQVVRQKMNQMLADSSFEWRVETIRAIEVLLAVALGEEEPLETGVTKTGGPQLKGEALKRELHDSFLQLLRFGASEATAGVLVLDDLHWADEASIEFLLHISKIVEDRPLLLLCALRPYRDSPAWRLRDFLAESHPELYTEVELRPLSDEDGGSLVSALLAISDLPDQLQRMIGQKTEGNPFFIEEVVRTLIDSGAVSRDESGMHWRAATTVEEITIPDNVQALLTARIDRLEKEVRRTLQLASVIGRSFYYRVLAIISEMAARLDEQLNSLQDAELIVELASAPELEYIFRHELTRDAAYRSILRRNRRHYHRRVGEALEALFPERLAEEAPRLAYHFDAAGEQEHALKYYQMAGDVAARLFANADAVSAYTRALEIASSSGAKPEQIIQLYAGRGRALELTGEYDEAIQNYQELRQLGLERGNPSMQLSAILPLSTIYSTPTINFDPQKGRALSDEALILARMLDDRAAEAKAYWNMMLLEHFAGDAQQAVAHGEQSVTIARELNLQEQLAFALNDISRAYLAVSDWDKARAAGDEARELWQSLGNLPMQADNLTWWAGTYFATGRFEKSLALAEEALQISRSIDSAWGQVYSLLVIGPIHMQRGDVAKAVAALKETISLAEASSYSSGIVMAPFLLAWLYGYLGDFARAYEVAELVSGKIESPLADSFKLAITANLQLLEGHTSRASQTLKDSGTNFGLADVDPTAQAFTALIAGEIMLAVDEFEPVLELAENTISKLRQFGVRVFMPELLTVKGRALLGLGQSVVGYRSLRDARSMAEEIESRTALWPILAELSGLEAGRGHQDKAETLLAQAQEIIYYIAGQTNDDGLRTSFLARPDVRAALTPAG